MRSVRRRPARSRRRSTALAACAIALVTAAAGGPAAAQEGLRPGSLELEVVGLTGVLNPGGRLSVHIVVRNRLPARVDGLRVSATLGSPVVGRNAFTAALDTGDVGATWASSSYEIGGLDGGASRTATVERDAVDLGLSDRVERFGVYPLQVQLFADDVLADDVTTSIVFVSEVVEEPVRWSALLPVDAPPGRLVGGAFDRRLVDELSAGGRLWRLARELSAFAEGGDVGGLALAMSSRLLDEAVDLADGAPLAGGGAIEPDGRLARQAAAFVERIRDAARRAPVDQVALSYGPADLVALVRGGLDEEAVRLLAEGESLVEELTGDRPAPGVLAPFDGLDADTLSVARAAGVDVVVLEERHLRERPPLNLSPAPARPLRSPDGTTAVALVPDARIAEVLRTPSGDGVTVDVQRVLAESAVMYFERPFDPAPRGLLVAPPRGWQPVPGQVQSLLEGLRDAPWLRPVRLRALATGTARDGGVARLHYPAAAQRDELPPSYVARLALARTALEPLASVLPDEDETASRYASDLLVAASFHFRDPLLQPQGRARIDQVLAALGQLSGAVSVVETPPITLTSEVGQVPVTLRSDASLPLRVHVRVSSARFAFDEAEERDLVLQPGVPVTITFTATALNPGGLWPVEVVVTDPEGTRVLEIATLAVRSTAYPLVALVVTGGAGLFLVVWWVREIARRRRGEEASGDRRRRAA